MVGELITLPLRVGARATQLWLRVATETVAVAANATGRLIDEVVSRPKAEPVPPAEAEVVPAAKAPAEPARTRPSTPTEVEAPDRYETPTEPEPVHVSEEPELVETVAEPGAEEGAGASVHVLEPWDGYDRMDAQAVIDRLGGASSAELAAVQLYESERKGRVTVLEAVERELRISSSSGSHT